jgi:ATP-binding cassette subfamily B protein
MAHSTEDGGAPSFKPLWRLMPYLWPAGRRDLKVRVIFSIVFLMLGIGVTTVSQQFFGAAINAFGKTPQAAVLWVVIALVASYAMARLLMQAFAQLRDGVFAPVQYHAMREVAVETFAHIHTLSLRFHLERKTGGLSRVIERGTRGIDNILSFALFSVFPIIFQVLIYAGMLLYTFNIWVALTAIIMVAAYSWFTIAVTRWRVAFRREMNQSDTDANTKAVDSLLNFETVKYFNNEKHETRRYDVSMAKYSAASIQSQTSLSILNTGQAAIIAVGQGIILVLAAMMVKSGQVSLGQP